MSEPMISVEGLGKKYTISHSNREPYMALRDVIGKGFSNFWKGSKGKAAKEEFWALDDIHFKVEAGESLGIVGRNGAGKSTLLKILSRITEPTRGRVVLNGRVASLLEVGTGFHPELTGRENIFLNGTILGMSRHEIRKKFDAIVEFSGVEKFLDTPVKYFSSGMYLRLAFSVAAHLEPEILVVDEVLAVGDAAFQQKCIGKMNEVQREEGRTVLLVSHNLAVLKKLCKTGIYLDRGKLVCQDTISTVVEKYFQRDQEPESAERDLSEVKKDFGFLSWKLSDSVSPYSIFSRDICKLEIAFFSEKEIQGAELGLVLRDYKGDIIYSCNNRDNGGSYLTIEKGRYTFNFEFRFPAKEGQYEIDIALVGRDQLLDQWVATRKLKVLANHESHLMESWQGIINEMARFTASKN